MAHWGAVATKTNKQNLYLERVRCPQAGAYNAVIQESRIPGSRSIFSVLRYQYLYRKCR